jgi:hypothetical protein
MRIQLLALALVASSAQAQIGNLPPKKDTSTCGCHPDTAQKKVVVPVKKPVAKIVAKTAVPAKPKVSAQAVVVRPLVASDLSMTKKADTSVVEVVIKVQQAPVPAPVALTPQVRTFVPPPTRPVIYRQLTDTSSRRNDWVKKTVITVGVLAVVETVACIANHRYCLVHIVNIQK